MSRKLDAAIAGGEGVAVVNTIIHGDCLEVMPSIPDKSIDMILCDLPYGTTTCKWDTVIPFEPLWEEYERLIKDNGAIVLTSSQPFTSILVTSKIDMYKYSWYWEKDIGTNYINAKHQPLKTVEEICVFSKANACPRCAGGGNMVYNAQGIVSCDKTTRRGSIGGVYKQNLSKSNKQLFENYPKNKLAFKGERGLHPTQKPVALFEYLIRTYTNEGETVLDNCIGSGTTAIACINTGRNYIGIEKEEKYVDIARKRIADHQQQMTLGVE